MSSRNVTARAMALALCSAGAWARATAEQLPAPPPELVERAGGAWIDIYRSWVELPDGNAMPVDPGPALCVGTDGFAVIDQNAVAGSLHLFATIRGQGPFGAQARAFDPRSALVVIELSSAALEGTPCLQLPDDAVAPVAAGDVLFALGPAGAEATPLRVRRFAPDALTFVGGLHGTFLAGSPLVDADGYLRGILVAGVTGGSIGPVHATGPLAGLAKRRHATSAIPLASVLTLVEQVKRQRENGMPLPPAVPVNRVSEEVFPRALWKAAGVTAEDLALYSAATAEAGVEFLTPPSLGAQEALARYAYVPGKTFFDWPEHVQMWEPMVVVQSSPRFAWSMGSRAKAVFAPLTLERGSEPIAPFDSFLECFDGAAVIEKEPGKYDDCRVKGCRTFYLFPPQVFAPGAGVIVRVAADAHGATVVVPVRPETQARIAADFAPWTAALREGAAGAPAPSPEAAVAPVPAVGVVHTTKALGNAELRITRPAGHTFVVTRLPRDGHLVIRIPVVWSQYSPFADAMTPGYLYVARDEVSFEPFKDPQTPKRGFSLPRAEIGVTKTLTRGLRIEGGGKKWYFVPQFELTQRPSLGEPFGSAFHQAQAGAEELAAKLLGDFDQAIHAFDAPEILNEMPVPGPPRGTTPPGGEPPDDRP